MNALHAAVLGSPNCVLLRKMNPSPFSSASSAPATTSTHFIGCSKAYLVKNITKSPNIISQQLSDGWLTKRRAEEEARKNHCTCKTICDNIAQARADGKKYFMPLGLDDFVTDQKLKKAGNSVKDASETEEASSESDNSSEEESDEGSNSDNRPLGRSAAKRKEHPNSDESDSDSAKSKLAKLKMAYEAEAAAIRAKKGKAKKKRTRSRSSKRGR